MQKMLQRSLFVLLVTAGLVSSAYAKDELVATVNGKAIPKLRADVMVEGLKAQGKEDNEELRAQVKEELVRREILSQAATAKGIEKDAALQQQIEMIKQGVIIQSYLQNYLKGNPVSDDTVRKEYDRVVGAMGSKEYKPRHILVKTEQKAKEIIAKLQEGAKFDDLAKDSEDPASRDRGGELNWSTPANYVPEFGQALMKLEKGKFTPQPVQSQFGFHIIKLDDVRDLSVPSFDDAKEQIRQRLQQQIVAKHINDLRQKAKVE